MQDWLKTFHGGNQVFPAVEIAVKVAVALARKVGQISQFRSVE